MPPSANLPLAPFTIDRRQPGPHEVLIEILYCGVRHSDIHQARDEWGGSIYPMVPGHEIIGVVKQTGAEVARWQAGEEQYCAAGANFTYNSRERDGKTPTYGGYFFRADNRSPVLCAAHSRRNSARSRRAFIMRRHNDLFAAAPFRCQQRGQDCRRRAVKLGKAMGAHVTVLSHTPGKRADALRLGADDFAVTHDPEVFTSNAARFSFILDTASAQHDYNAYLSLSRRGGTMVLVSLPEPAPLAAGPLIMGRRRLAGSLIGGIRETQEMLDFCAANGVAAGVEAIPVQRINEAYEHTLKNNVRYRFVIDLASWK